MVDPDLIRELANNGMRAVKQGRIMEHKISHGARGFTLLELLIVLVIIGVVIAAVALSIHNSGSSQESRSAANIFRARTMYAEQNAIIQSTTIGLAISQAGYQFYRLQNKPPSEVITWQKSTIDALRYQAWPTSMDLRLSLPGNANALIPNELPEQPMIIFNPSGGVTPFILKIDHFTVRAKANGAINIE